MLFTFGIMFIINKLLTAKEGKKHEKNYFDNH